MKMKKFELGSLVKVHEEFKNVPGNKIYNLARFITQEGGISNQICGAFILLATWNKQRFKIVKDYDALKDSIELAFENSKPSFYRLENERLETANLDAIQNDVIEIYSRFSKIRGVEYTGASKVMSINNTNLFVMWDKYIRDKYGFGESAEEYARFLKECQWATNETKWQHNSVSLAKAIDEYNYFHISLPAAQKSREEQKKHKINRTKKK